MISLNMREALYSQETGRYPIALITLTHPDITTIRLSTDHTQRIVETATELAYGTISRGETYVYVGARLKLPNQTPEGPGPMTIEIEDVEGQITEMVREQSEPLEALIEIVVDNDLDTVEIQFPYFLMHNIGGTATVISATMDFETLHREPWPADEMTPAWFPGLHERVINV